ncbi:ABC transporter permease [Kosmotoga sp. DU53]|uniref:ABC transporter permease n=1 Tax=Kosmotoga sp. DU53 TaxID=1310160 RepID=UPI0007C5B297|nr:ABC transporter permease [Kosmotoga sp. DU53]OAA25559.1 sugar ABC transporter permease [Kosmotoga sp. DU53]
MLKNKIGISSKYSEVVILSVILVILMGMFSIMLPGRFLHPNNLQSMAFQLPELGILALAMMITMLTGGINLSIISSANLSGIVMALILTRVITPELTSTQVNWTILLAVLVGMTVSLGIGLVNGFIIAYLGVSPILATLGTMTFFEGISVVITRGYVISGFPEPILAIGNGTVFGIPVPMLIFIGAAIFVAILLNKTRLGLLTYMIGSNIKATMFSGINVNKIIMKVYTVSGILSGLAALIMVSRFNSAKAGYGSSYLLITVLVSVLGGVNPNGGFGKVSGVVMGLILLQVISSGLNLLGLSAHLTIALWGGILLAVEGIRLLRNKHGLGK